MNKSLNKQILLSIIIPVYNRQQSLEAYFSDLSKSKNFDKLNNSIEVIIVDDASVPPLLESFSKKAKYDFQLKFFHLDKNSGAPKAREYGFKQSQGQFVHFHDSDDSITTNWLSQILQEIRSSPNFDMLVTGRLVKVEGGGEKTVKPKFFHNNINKPKRILSWLIYQNCIGPLGGVTFSNKVLGRMRFLSFYSCQDWQMYIDALMSTSQLRSRPDILFVFNQTGNDRISRSASRKILGHLQLSKVTSEMFVFKGMIRLFYLYSCRQYILKKEGAILQFYNKNKYKIFIVSFVVSTYWKLTRKWF